MACYWDSAKEKRMLANAILLRASSALLCLDFRSRGNGSEANMTHCACALWGSITSDINTSGAVDIAEYNKRRETFYVKTNC